jgi:predicted phosphodiesterase
MVISDLHAYDSLADKEQTPSILQVSNVSSPTVDPLGQLAELVRDNKIKVDVVVCPGDMGDKARPIAIAHVWDRLRGLASQMSAKHLIGTVGNHDCDSRHSYSFDARGHLQNLPGFPVSDVTACHHFWSRNFAIISEKQYRIVILNTCAFQYEQKDEQYHGRVSARTVKWLEEALTTLPSKDLNILVCHHHLFPLSYLYEDSEYSSAVDGDRLIHLLGSGHLGEWLVIHGHRHRPYITRGFGTASAPVFFGAGSFSAMNYPPGVPNQFYVIEIDLNAQAHGLRGRFESYTWGSARGWDICDSQGLPKAGGFGFAGNLAELAAAIADSTAQNLSAAELRRAFPAFEFVFPKDVEKFEAHLKDRGLAIQHDARTGQIEFIGPRLEETP